MKHSQSDRGLMLRRILQLVLLGMGIGFIAYGLCNHEMQSVMGKAVFICYECIGIG